MKTNMAALKKKKKIIKRKIPKTVKRKTVVKKIAVKKKKTSVLNLKRSNKKPIITPTSGRSWESKASFNPTAIFHDGKVHIIYRAIGDSDNSVLGYAQSTDGVSFDQNFKELAYSHANAQSFSKTEPQINYLSGGGWGGGCEDPWLTLLGDQVYMIYTAFDGWGSVRMALTSISLDDFISKRFNWKKPVLISPPSEIHKNWALFPEKIRKGGKEKYAILHAISPKIMIDYFDSLNELDGNKYIYSVHQGSRLWESRDKLTRGIGPSPIKAVSGITRLERGGTVFAEVSARLRLKPRRAGWFCITKWKSMKRIVTNFGPCCLIVKIQLKFSMIQSNRFWNPTNGMKMRDTKAEWCIPAARL